MARLQFDTQDRAALQALDHDFEVSNDGETASITGEMTVEVIRAADDQLQLTITFPGGEEFIVRLARSQLLQELDVGDDENA